MNSAPWLADRSQTTSQADPPPFSAVPEELRTRPQWVIWRYGPPRNGGKRPKMPYNPLSFATASVTDPSTWATFDEALAALKSKSGAFNGLGYVFSADDPFTGVDLDGCVNGEVVTSEARDLITTLLGAYVELSVSGNGIHAIVRAQLPGPGRRRGAVECYDRSRFFVVTGHALSEPGAIADAQAVISTLYAELGNTSGETKSSGASTSPSAPAPTSTPVSLDNGYVEWLSKNKHRLLDPKGIPFGATAQLRALLERDELPPALRAKGDSPSERRALIVRQLGRTGYMPEEIYVLSLHLWNRHGYASKRAKDMITDVMRLITAADLKPEKYSRYSLDRHKAYVRTRPKGNLPTTPEPPATPAHVPTPHRAPCSSTAYLDVLQRLEVEGVIAAPRRERADVAQVSLKTAQRIEARLQAEGVLQIEIYSQPHTKGHPRASLIRMTHRESPDPTPAPLIAEETTPNSLSHTEDSSADASENTPTHGITPNVHTTPKDTVAHVHTTIKTAKLSIRTAQTDVWAVNFAIRKRGEHSVCVRGGGDASGATAATAAPHTPCAAAGSLSGDVSPIASAVVRNLVRDALDAYGTSGGKAAFRRVVTHLKTVGGCEVSEEAIERVYRVELEQRRRVRADAALRVRVEAMSMGQCEALLRSLANRMASDRELASSLERQPFMRDPLTGEDTEVRRSRMTPAALRARAGIWSRQYDIVAEIHDVRRAQCAKEWEAARAAATVGSLNDMMPSGEDVPILSPPAAPLATADAIAAMLSALPDAWEDVQALILAAGISRRSMVTPVWNGTAAAARLMVARRLVEAQQYAD
ncbi:MAG: hypothetical protein WCK70_02900 [Chloroflexales bacterium]